MRRHLLSRPAALLQAIARPSIRNFQDTPRSARSEYVVVFASRIDYELRHAKDTLHDAGLRGKRQQQACHGMCCSTMHTCSKCLALRRGWREIGDVRPSVRVCVALVVFQ